MWIEFDNLVLHSTISVTWTYLSALDIFIYQRQSALSNSFHASTLEYYMEISLKANSVFVLLDLFLR